jgi:hypothetical protein
VYNVAANTVPNTSATLKATRPSNANGLRIKNTDINTSAVDISGNVFDISYNITLTDSVVERSYEIRARYYSVDTPAPTFQYVDSLPVTVTFKNGTSNRPRPVIKSKNYITASGTNKYFTVTYGDCDNAGSWLNSNTALVSNVYVKKTGATDVDVGTNDGSVDISVFNGDNVDIYVQDKFTTTYKVTPQVTVVGGITNINGNGTDRPSLVQTVNSQSSLPFYLAANPQIDENSIVVDGTNKVMTVNVKNMGNTILNNAMLVVSQDSTINEGDKGYYGVAYFDNQAVTGFSSTESNKLVDISGNALTTLSVTAAELGMSKVTTLTFSSINLANANPVNVSLFVGNTVEGSDSCAVANKAIVYPYAAPVLSGSVVYAAGYTATATYTFNTNVSAIKVMKSDGTTIIASQAVSSGTAPIVIPYTDADISGAKSFYVVALGNSFNSFAPESMASASQLLKTPPVSSSFTQTNLLARYDASVASSYTLSGGNVTTWNDLTGNGYHLTANGSGPTTTTINSITAFDFNSNRGLIRTLVPLTTPITMFMVATYRFAAGTWGNFMHHGDHDFDWSLRKTGNSNYVNFHSNNDNTDVQLLMSNNTNYIWVCRIVGNTREFWAYSDTQSTRYISGTPVTITAGIKTLYVGRSDTNEACNSTIGEILYYNASLSDADVTKNVGYLQNKWFNIPTPTQTNLLARYDASVASSYTLSGGGNVTTWNDLTGNGYHLTANGTGPTVSTINTISAFNFNPGRGLKYSSMPLAANITVFMVAKYSTFIGGWGNFMHHGNRDSDWSIRRNGGNNTIDFTSGQNGTTELPVANNVNYIFVGRIVGTGSTATKQFWMYSDTVALQYATAPPVTITPGNKPLYVGMSDATWQNESCNGTIGEILYYNASLSDADVTKNVAYLQNKWFNIPTTPTQTNLLARYDASVASSYTLNGGNVTQWNDLTGNGYHLIPSGTGPTTTTINSVPAFNFNSGRGLKSLSVPLAAQVTVFIVAKYSSLISQFGTFIQHGVRYDNWVIRRNGTNIDFNSGENGTAMLPVSNDKNYIFVGRIVGTTKQFWVYSETSPVQYVTNPPVRIAASSSTPIYVGISDNSGESSNSTIGEILYYNASLSDADVTQNVAYLKKKWFI